MDIDNNIIKLANQPYNPKSCSLLYFISYLSSSFLFLVRFKLLYFNQITKQKGLYGQVNNITSTADPPIRRILFNILLFREMRFYRPIEGIICYSVIRNNRSKFSYDTVVLKDIEKSSKLLVSAIVYYSTKGKEGL